MPTRAVPVVRLACIAIITAIRVAFGGRLASAATHSSQLVLSQPNSSRMVAKRLEYFVDEMSPRLLTSGAPDNA
jgi:hypothetical protein